MKKYLLVMSIGVLGLIAGYYILTLAEPSTNEPRQIAAENDSRSEQLLVQYQAALVDANSIIEEMNIDISTAQQVQRLDELESYVDAMPLRDTVAHPQP